MGTVPPTSRYTTVAIILHWLIAAALIFQVGLGLRMEGLRGGSRFAVFQLHKSVGMTILVLVVLRLTWRLYRDPPPLATSAWERTLARSVHVLFYVLLFALPLSGWLIVSTSRIAVPTLLYGAIPLPHLPGFGEMATAARAAWNGVANFMHQSLVYILYAGFALHVAGALKHHFLDTDGGLARMAPGAKPGAWADPRLIAIAVGVVLTAGLGLSWAPDPRAAITPPIAEAPVPPPPAAAPSPLPAVLASTPDGQASDNESTAATSNEAATEEVPSWTIAPGSALRFRTAWSGDAIEGGFTRFDGDITFSPDQLDRSHVKIRIQTASIFSGDAQRDETLKSDDWFSVGSFGAATFEASKFRKTGKDHYVATGTLEMKGVTLAVSMPFSLTIRGDEATMQGNATIDRTAYKIGEGDYSSTSEIPAAVSVDTVVHATRKR